MTELSEYIPDNFFLRVSFLLLKKFAGVLKWRACKVIYMVFRYFLSLIFIVWIFRLLGRKNNLPMSTIKSLTKSEWKYYYYTVGMVSSAGSDLYFYIFDFKVVFKNCFGASKIDYLIKIKITYSTQVDYEDTNIFWIGLGVGRYIAAQFCWQRPLKTSGS